MSEVLHDKELRDAWKSFLLENPAYRENSDGYSFPVPASGSTLILLLTFLGLPLGPAELCACTISIFFFKEILLC